MGIWHETYLVRAGEYEAIYSGMPPFGLGAVGRLVLAAGRRESARGRLERDASAIYPQGIRLEPKEPNPAT